MEFELDEEQKLLRDTITRFAKTELRDDVHARDRDHTFSHELWRKCGELGLQGLPVPEELGGGGLDPVTTAVALEAFGYGCTDSGLVFSLCAHLLACTIPIWKHGSPEQHERYLRKLCDGSLIAVNAMTEPDTGSDAFAMTTTAVPDGDGFRINGTKTFCSNGPVADLAVVYAVTDAEKRFHGGVTGFLVPKGTEGFRLGQTFEKLGLRTSPISELVFEDAWVPNDAVLGQVGGASPIFVESMDWERALIAATHVGKMQRILDQAREYARTRRQYGHPISKFQAISHKIADMRVRLEASRQITYLAASKLGRSREANLYASMAKLYVSEELQKCAQDLVQIHGGYGFMVEYDAERILRDSVGSTLYSGTSEIQRNIIARWLGL